MTVHFGHSKKSNHNSNPSISAKEKPAETRVFPLFMRVFRLFAICVYCSIFALFCVLRAQKIHSKIPRSKPGIFILSAKNSLQSDYGLFLHPQRYLTPCRKGLAVLHTGGHPQGPGPIGDHQPRNILYPIAGKTRPQRRARPHQGDLFGIL